MKKLILILLLFPTLSYSQIIKNYFNEFNIGIAIVDVDLYDYSVFPGFSVVMGKTAKYNSLVKEWQFGLGLPTIFTAKLGLGLGTLKNNVMLTIRPWPFFIGPQLKIGRLTASLEVGLKNEISFYSGIITTFAYRVPTRKTTNYKKNYFFK